MFDQHIKRTPRKLAAKAGAIVAAGARSQNEVDDRQIEAEHHELSPNIAIDLKEVAPHRCSFVLIWWEAEGSQPRAEA
ncbi:hypothetical protein [Novosphingobium sp.]|uniref:hypothetical protein n=1 Tax=Novosphingobium sp. TaxID=1874826 RepID=UPI0038B79943